MSETNGRPLPAITITWDDANKVAAVHADTAFFKNFDFVKAVIDIAGRAVDDQRRLQQMQQMQRAAAEHQQAQIIRRSLRT